MLNEIRADMIMMIGLEERSSNTRKGNTFARSKYTVYIDNCCKNILNLDVAYFMFETKISKFCTQNIIKQ